MNLNKSKINILIVSHEPLTVHLKELYSLKELSKDFNIEFISLRSYFFKKNMFYFANELSDEFKDFSSLIEFRRYIKKYNYEDTYIFLENSSVHLGSFLVDFIVKDYKLCYFILYRSWITAVDDTFKPKFLIPKILKLFKLSALKFFLINKFSVKNFHFVFAAGLLVPNIKTKKFIALNSTVFSKSENITKTSKHIVFIDQGYPTHIDLRNKGYKSKNEFDFINSYNRFFDFIESSYDLKVVIAKHPKSTVNDEFFLGREIYIGKTKELIRNSKFVIAHSSLINLFAISIYKPICLIFNSEIKKFPTNCYLNTLSLSKLLDIDLINIDNSKFNKINLSINKQKYKSFIDNYIQISDQDNSTLISNAIFTDYNNIY